MPDPAVLLARIVLLFSSTAEAVLVLVFVLVVVGLAQLQRSIGQQRFRVCPFCRFACSPLDAVCPACASDIGAWTFADGRWSTTKDGVVFSLNEQNEWVAPSSPRQSYDVVVHSAGPKPAGVVRAIASERGIPKADVTTLLGDAPVAVLTGVGFATAEGFRAELARRGAIAELVTLDT